MAVNSNQSNSRGILAFLCACLLASLGIARAATETFTIDIEPPGSGVVLWTCVTYDSTGVSGSSSGVFTKPSSTLTFPEFAWLTLTFNANPGFTLDSVVRPGRGPETLVNGNQFLIGPTTVSLVLVATFLPPIGAFQFNASNNPSAQVIGDISGVYSGTTPATLTKVPRDYNLTVAEDDAGKLAAMGTISGIEQKAPNGSLTTNLADGNVGDISSVNGTPTGQIKGAFNGTVDGKTLVGRLTAEGPLSLASLAATSPTALITSGTVGFQVTASYQATLDGVPKVAKDAPYFVPVSPDAMSQYKTDWTLNLTITKKLSTRGKQYVAADANITLPNQEKITFPEQKVKYSAKTGYRLALSRGKTADGKVDKKTSVLIQGMTLIPNGNNWVPNGGTITYKFLGQKGTGNLVDFLD